MKLDEKQLEQSLEYLKQFLLRGNNCFCKYINYTDEWTAREICKNKTGYLYIIKSGFFDEKNYGESSSLPMEPLPEYGGGKFFYGKSKEEYVNGNCLLFVDIIASTYFVITRYEEYIRLNIRDIYGNFSARESILYRQGLLDVPIVDLYGEILVRILSRLGHNMQLNKNGFDNLYFTHDIDVPFEHYTFKRMVKTIGKGLLNQHRLVISPLLNYLGNYSINPRNTWNYMLLEEKGVARKAKIATKSICFIIASETPDKYTSPYIHDKKIKPILTEMKEKGAVIGLHTSYDGALDEKRIRREKLVLEEVSECKVNYQRNHYLRQLHPSDIAKYESAGFTDDFTTGFNEMPGFRLGTCHPVRWIDPANGRLSSIVLHGLQIMDGSLDGAKPYQLELSYERAEQMCKHIIDEVYYFHGEICILWHNGVFEKSNQSYMKKLYDWLIEYIKKLTT